MIGVNDSAKMEVNDKRVVQNLLDAEMEISHKFHNATSEIMRLGYNTKRGREQVDSLIDSVEYSLKQLKLQISRY